jgi:hypothetical protein
MEKGSREKLSTSSPEAEHAELVKGSSLPDDRNSLVIGEDGSIPTIDLAAEKKLLRKLDLHIIPIVMLLYLFSFIDRYVITCSHISKLIFFISGKSSLRETNAYLA